MIRFAQKQDFEAVRTLWETCFPDESGFNPYYFSHLYRARHTLLLEEGTLCAMTQMLPYTLQSGETVTYIYGACTAPDARKQGYMARLLRHSFMLDRARGRSASILIPQEPWLFDFYKKFGYQTAYYACDQSYIADGACSKDVRRCTETEIPQLAELYKRRTALQTGALQRTAMAWQVQLSLFHTLGAGVWGLFARDGRMRAYAFVWNGAPPWAQELLAEDEAATEELASAVCSILECRQLRLTAPGTQYALGMAKFYDNRMVAPGYINLMLN